MRATNRSILSFELQLNRKVRRLFENIEYYHSHPVNNRAAVCNMTCERKDVSHQRYIRRLMMASLRRFAVLRLILHCYSVVKLWAF